MPQSRRRLATFAGGVQTNLSDLLLGADGAPDAELVDDAKEVLRAVLLACDGVQLPAGSCTPITVRRSDIDATSASVVSSVTCACSILSEMVLPVPEFPLGVWLQHSRNPWDGSSRGAHPPPVGCPLPGGITYGISGRDEAAAGI